MQVVDLRRERPHRPATLEVWASTAAELMTLIAFVEHGDDDSFDVGAARAAEVRAALPAGPLAQALDDGDGNLWKRLTHLVGLLDAPGDVEQLLTMLREVPERPWRAMLVDWCHDDGIDGDLLDAHLAGELSNAALVDAVGQREDITGTLAERMISEGPAWFGRWLLDVLEPIHDAVRDTLLAEAMGPIQREVDARRAQLEAGTDTNTLLVEATNGYEHGADVPVDRILLTPSYWFRPWLLIGRVEGTEVITSPVADEHLALPSQAPPPSLVKLCKALGDEGRLRLLRRMGGGAIQLADAMDELDVAKTTAHHHLAILRTAGLVVVRGEGRGTTYALRTDAAAMTHDALADYIGPAIHTAAASG